MTTPVAVPPPDTAGARAERLVETRVRAALPREEGYRVWANVRWLGRTKDRGAFTDGEADLVIAHPDRGLLVVETKAGEIRRDDRGRWFAGAHELKPDPFTQATRSLHALLRKLDDLPDSPPDFHPVAGHAVALPDVDLASAGARAKLLGPDVVADLILDHAALLPEEPTVTRRAVEGALASFDAPATRPPGAIGLHLLEELLDTPVELHSLLKSEILEGNRQVVELTDGQIRTLKNLSRQRRVEVVGAAGTGKTLLAAWKAGQLASQGYETLLVCFNQPLARLLTELTAEAAERHGRVRVSTFHQLCEDLGREAGVLPAKPAAPIPQSWWDETLPRALDEARERLGPQFHAIVIDEGQDFEADWLLSLQELLYEPKDDVVYVFHDPGQAIYRTDVIASLGLAPVDLDLNCRNPGPIHAFAMSHALGAPAAEAMRTDGRAVEIIEAEPGGATLDALRRVLHRLRVDEKVPPWQIAVLTGASLEKSEVWRQRTFGNESLWNGQVDVEGKPLGLAAGAVAEQPSDAIAFDSIRRFKGMERPVIVLVEVSPDDPRLERLLYVGASRATQHLIVIRQTPPIAERTDY